MSWGNGYQTRRGEQAPNSKLNAAAIDAMRALRESGYTLQEIAQSAGVSINTVRRALIGETYSD